MNTKEILLCLLLEGPMTGYDIKKILDVDISNVADIRINNLYPLLNDLAEEGLVRYTRVEQEKRPNKKIYELTETGRDACLRALMSCEARQSLRSEFLFVMKFSSWLPPSRIEALMSERLDDIHGALDALDSKENRHLMSGSPENKFAFGLARAQLQAEADFISGLGRKLICGDKSTLRRSAASRRCETP